MLYGTPTAWFLTPALRIPNISLKSCCTTAHTPQDNVGEGVERGEGSPWEHKPACLSAQEQVEEGR